MRVYTYDIGRYGIVYQTQLRDPISSRHVRRRGGDRQNLFEIVAKIVFGDNTFLAFSHWLLNILCPLIGFQKIFSKKHSFLSFISNNLII